MFSLLERNILMAKGLDESQLAHLERVGIDSKAAFTTVGNAETLIELVGLAEDRAAAVMSWAMGVAITAAPVEPAKLVVESADAVYCVHCRAKQPNDYSSGDLCGSCGRQAEPTRSCFWCGGNGPGIFCRGCGTEYVPTGELELAAQLKRDGLPKDEIHPRLMAMTAAEKDALWGRVRRR